MPPSTRLARISSRVGVWVTGILGLAVLCVFARTKDAAPGDRGTRLAERMRLYPETQPAKNPERLTLVLDANQVVGWLSATANHVGEVATVTLGENTETVWIGEDNSFVWPYKVSKNTRATFAFGKHKQTLTLTPREQPAPSVYFVADRSVYRPGQPFHFAGFLRQLDERGEFVPVIESEG